MSRKLTKQEKIDFIKSLDSLSEHEKSLLLAEIEKIDTLESLERYIDENIPESVQNDYRTNNSVQ